LHKDVAENRLGSVLLENARRVLVALAWIAAGLLAFGVGFALVHWVWPNPSERLTRDLPIAEHLDELREVGSFDYLKELVESPEFDADRD
jgi:hypothetical protein